MQYIMRNNCAVSGASDLEPLYTFKNFTVFMGCTEQPYKNDIFADME